MVAVDTCTLCDKNGENDVTDICEKCENGFLHKKENGKLICRKCGKECETRFSPCVCGQGDCPNGCDKGKIVTKRICPFCRGDKTITPMERLSYETKGKK